MFIYSPEEREVVGVWAKANVSNGKRESVSINLLQRKKQTVLRQHF